MAKLDRWDILTHCLIYDRKYKDFKGKSVFATMERIYIHYERACMLRGDTFTQPEALEGKIKQCITVINTLS